MSNEGVPKLAPKAISIPLARIFSPVNHKNFRFLILDCPTDSTLPIYLQELKNRGVTDVVRVCEPTYNKEVLVSAGVQVHDWPFPDGGVPPKHCVQNWLQLVEDRFGNIAEGGKEVKGATPPTIAVHCVAGLGRAPVLVAIALIEAGMSPLDAVEYVRKFRRGAFNSVQIGYLDTYKRGAFSSSLRKLRMPTAGSSKDLTNTAATTAAASTGGFFSIKRVPSPLDEKPGARRGSPSPTGEPRTAAPASNGYGTAQPAQPSNKGISGFFRSFGSKKSGSPTPPTPPANPPSPPGSGSASTQVAAS